MVIVTSPDRWSVPLQAVAVIRMAAKAIDRRAGKRSAREALIGRYLQGCTEGRYRASPRTGTRTTPAGSPRVSTSR